ncbi:MAG: MMPL family transporter [Actinomycetota bacterium]|nr:MMPL family transporter [Actinomycetota bacterium]
MARVREEYDRTGDNSEAVADGLAVTARVISAAALIMVFVFGSFMLEDLRTIKILGVGLAVAVAIDATVVRMLLVSATVAAIVNPTGPWLFVLAAAFGSLAFPMYSLAVSMINDVMPPRQLIAAAAGIIFVYAIGSIVGPIAVSVLMQIVGPVGYFWGLAMVFVPLVLYALVRIVFTARPKQHRFINLPYHSSTAAALFAEPSEDE